MEAQQADTIIGVDVSVKGNLKNKGSIQINGNVEGEIKSDENVTIGSSASVKGPVMAKNILVSGKVDGVVEATEKVELDPTGAVSGDIKTKTLIIREGAIFNGNSIMAGAKETPGKTEKDELKDEVIAESTPKAGFWDKNKK
ncbi:MAG: polymer-forming cytoskeletal protein [Patescibacteria group bacterium]|jgi:cytoskeletal protein CcmA (bactofilin family)